MVIRVKLPGIGGYFDPGAFPMAKDVSVSLENHGPPSPQRIFSVGDRVYIDPSIKTHHEDFIDFVKEVINKSYSYFK